MQRHGLKILPVYIALIFCLASSSIAQVSSFRLKTADSLFQAKRYTQSFEHYSEIFAQKQYSPAMLLKMAYIQEGLGNIGQAMYYLNLYFLVTNDEATLAKMEELAEKYDLEGYETTDADRLLTFYHDYYAYITYATAALIVLMLAIVFYSKARLKVRPVISSVLVIFFAAIFFVHLNFGARVQTAIITSQTAYIMEGPSAGASLITIIGGGHRVEVIGKNDVWLKIRWNENVAYIRGNSLLPVQL